MRRPPGWSVVVPRLAGAASRVHRGHALEDGDLVALDDLAGLLRIKARDQRERAAAEDRRIQSTGLAER